MYFLDRQDAGRRLAAHIQQLLKEKGISTNDVLVLALPRGGVPVGYEVAAALHAPLDVFIVRKLGTPGHSELAMGAIASGGVRLLNDEVIGGLKISEAEIERVTGAEMVELERREAAYRGGLPERDVREKTVLLIDDGLATGHSMLAAVKALRQSKSERIVVAVPVGPPDICAQMQQQADEVICLATPRDFSAVGTWYRDFTQTSDEEVHELLARADARF